VARCGLCGLFFGADGGDEAVCTLIERKASCPSFLRGEAIISGKEHS